MKFLIYNTSLLFLLSLLTCSLNAQPSEPGFPATLLYHLPTGDIPVINLPYFNNEELKAADTCETCSEAFGIDALAEFDFWQQSQKQVVNNSNENVEIYRVKAGQTH